MDFISWLVIGVLFMLAETGMGTRHLLAIGLACIYPSIASFAKAGLVVQLTVLAFGVMAHLLAITALRRHVSSTASEKQEPDIGQPVEVIEWLDETTARVRYRGTEWQADKARGEMPDAVMGIIQAVQGGRLIISTEKSPAPPA
jgi:membrane protein implicated in regulation of membrane protease activity